MLDTNKRLSVVNWKPQSNLGLEKNRGNKWRPQELPHFKKWVWAFYTLMLAHNYSLYSTFDKAKIKHVPVLNAHHNVVDKRKISQVQILTWKDNLLLLQSNRFISLQYPSLGISSTFSLFHITISKLISDKKG